ncbi:FMN-dependent dehydrogenase-domain-containing protein [Xylaria sp. FL0933]|nr:FMN-dependent dehydrogenase-domain-containing protein [Xylaria sp. FL0933]
MEAKDSGVLSAQEIATHRSTSSCWIVVGGKVYDVTSYLDEHPGGAAVLLKQGGTDATAEFRKIHSPDILKYLPKDACLGSIDAATRAALPISRAGVESTGDLEAEGSASEIPHISSIVVPNDFEAAAKAAMPLKSWTYVSSSAHDGSALRANLASWHAVRFRPRIFHDVSTVDARTSILGSPSSFPFYVSPMGQLGRGHATAEIGVVRALARRGVHGVLSAESTVKLEEIAAAFLEEKKKVLAEAHTEAQNNRLEAQLHFQLYVPEDRSIAVQRIRRARATGAFRSLWVTVDTPVLGKRTADRKLQAAEALATSPELAAHAERAGFGLLSHAGPSLFNSTLTWDDVAWIKREWGGPVVLKGVQTAEDAACAAEMGLEGVLLSNHGGRQMHGAPDALTTLLEIREYYPGLVDRVEVFVDGGCRDGADVLKAVALGARAVGVGRPFFYALATYGEKGVERCADIFADELVTGMKLVGMKDLKEATPERVNASRLLNEIWRPEKSRL